MRLVFRRRLADRHLRSRGVGWFFRQLDREHAGSSLAIQFAVHFVDSGRYAERPTITYSPLSGEKFRRSLMTPIPPAAILNFLQAGYPVEMVLRLAVHSINGIRTRYGGGARMREADPEFYTLIETLSRIQQSGDIGMRVRRTGEQTATFVVFSKKPSAAVEADRAEVRKLLGIDPKAEELNVVYGSVASNDKEIAILTRSMLEILIDLSSYIDVPATSATEKRTFPTPAQEIVNGVPVLPLIRIHSSPKNPGDAFAAVDVASGLVLD